MYLSRLEREGYTGIDASIDIALYEYGMIWKYIKSDNEYRFYYKVNSEEEANKCLFDWDTINADIDIWEEFNWIDSDDKGSFLSFLGMTEDKFNAQGLPNKIYDLVNYFGHLNIFGDNLNSFRITPGSIKT